MTQLASRSPSQILRDARQLIAVPDQWTQGQYARDKCGSPVRHGSPEAVCWCSAGAIRKVEADPTEARGDAILYLHLAINEHRTNEGSTTPIPTFNDNIGTTHADVLKAFDRAIEIAVKREQGEK